MLIHVQPDKVGEHWDFFADVIGDSLPPNIYLNGEGMSMVLSSALLEKLHVWVYEDGDGKAVFVMSTTVLEDPVTGQKNLLIYSFTSLRKIEPSMWEESFETLRKFAKAQGAVGIIAYTENDRIANYVQSLGARTSNRLIQFTL